MAGARRGHLGGARARAALHPFEGDGVGRVRPGDRAIEARRFEGPVERWQRVRDESTTSLPHGLRRRRGTFTQYYGSRELDASLLMIPLVGFLPAGRPRMARHGRGDPARARRRRIRAALLDGRRVGVDGLPPGEGGFLPCTFWLADNLCPAGPTRRGAGALRAAARRSRNDVGLLSEEYDPAAQRLVGNFPQAFSHVALVNTARNLTPGPSPSEHRGGVENQ